MADFSPEEARISELLRLRVVAQAGDDVLAYIDEVRQLIHVGGCNVSAYYAEGGGTRVPPSCVK